MPIVGFDHIAMPVADPERCIAFYKRLGFTVPNEEAWRQSKHPVVSFYVGQNKINAHPPGFRPALRAPAAEPGCADLCFVWEGGLAALQAMLASAGVAVEAGPTAVPGSRLGKKPTSIYIRDPEQNLLEFTIYD